MTRSETGVIKASLRQSQQSDDEPYYQMEIGGITPRNFEGHLSLPPHTSKKASNGRWTRVISILVFLSLPNWILCRMALFHARSDLWGHHPEYFRLDR